MYLIKTARDMIYDLENGRVYLNHGNSIAMFDSPVSVGVLIAEDSYDECDRTWNHMSDLCKHDATADPQPAPVETPRKFKDGDEPYVTNGKRSHFGEQIMVAGYTSDDYVISVDGDTYRESELEPAD